jgi:capsular polysaccharide transport system permease protein
MPPATSRLIGGNSLATRSPWQVMWSVWSALFLREALARLFSRRGAWVWLFLEPIFHVAYLVFVYSVIRVRLVSGFDTSLWIVVGILAYFVFTRASEQASNAVNANRQLFSYRQVHPVDTIFVRAAIEIVMLLVLAIFVFGGLAMLGHDVWPHDSVQLIFSFLLLWLLAIGWGMIRAVLHDLVPELEIVLDFFMKPMYLISGVIVPLASIPFPYRDWLLYNPIAQGIEAARSAFSVSYHPVGGLSFSYLLGATLMIFFFGLLLMRRFSTRLVTA